jgi:3-oxoacyl-[acyl-carrier protein] reductase
MREPEAAETVRAIEAAGRRAVVQLADVSEPDGAQALIKATVERFGHIDVLVNNAALRREVPFEQLDWTQ